MNKIAKQFYDSGLIDKAALDRLDETSEMLKEAGWLDSLKGYAMGALKASAPTAIGTGVGLLGANYFIGKEQDKQNEISSNQLNTSLNQIMMNPEFKGRETEVTERFNQIAQFSPTLAKVPAITANVIGRTLDNGLDERDIKNLSTIEAGQAQVRSAPVAVPMAATMFQNSIAPMVTNFATAAINPEKVIEGLPQEAQNNIKMKPASDIHTGLLIRTLISIAENLPAELSQFKGLTKLTPPMMQTIAGYFQRNPSALVDLYAQNNMVDDWNEIIDESPASTIKKASADLFTTLSEEAKAEILADQYLLTKEAAGASTVLKNSLLGLGAAALFGAGGAILEGATAAARTNAQNTALRESWAETKIKLKKLSKEDSNITAGQDFTSSHTVGKAEEAFRVLSSIAPGLAVNSTIAVPFVARVVQQEGDISPDVLKMISEVQKNINTNKQYRSPFIDNPTLGGFSGGFEFAGGREFLKNISKD